MINKKIIYIIDNLRIGGAQVHLLRLASQLSNKGYAIEIASLSNVDELSREFDNRLTVYRFPMDCIWKLKFWRNFFVLIAHLKRRQPAIVHAYLNTSNVFGVLAAKLSQVPIIICSRRDAGHFRSKRIATLEKITAKISDKIICISESIRNTVAAKEDPDLNKLVVIYNGVDSHVFKRRNKNNHNRYFNISMAATMDRKIKGHSYFVEAAELIIKERKNVRFSLIGDGPLRPSLESYVNSKGLSDYFEFRGQRTDLSEELQNTDIFVVPSESEGCSNSLLEAMAMGIPAIATAVEGNLEIIEEGVSGFLVPPKNPTAIAEKILELLATPNEMNEVGINARERIIEKFTLDIMVKNYIELYEGLIEEKIQNKATSFKIGYVVSLFPCWSEVFILNEIIELEKKGVEINIFSVRNDLEKFIQEEAKPYIKKTTYINIPRGIISAFLWFIKRPITIFAIFVMVLSKKHNSLKELLKNIWCIFLGCFFADIALSKKLERIHAHFATYPALTAFVVSKLTKIPFSFTAHAHDIFLNKTFLRELTNAAKEVVTISNYNKEYIADYCKNGVASKIKVIHCGVNLSDYRPALAGESKEENIILSIGRLTEMKGFEYLIRACMKIKAGMTFKCHIVGEGPLRKDLTELVKTSGLKESVVFDGVLDNIRIKQLLSKANLFVLPSIWSDKDGQDGIPVVLMEAMASGIPVIASKISGIPELIEDGKTGLLVEPKNEQQLTEKIINLLNDKGLQKRLVMNARLKIEQDFDIVKNTDLLLDIFKKNKRIPKVLFIIWSLEKGGAERFLTSLAKSMDRNKIEPTVCCLNWKGAWAKELEDKGIQVIGLNKRRKIDFQAFIDLVKIIKNGKFDIVNTYLWGADVMGRLAAIFAGVPVIVSTAENVDIWKKWWHRLIDKLLSYRTNKIIAVSGAVKEYYHKKIGIPLAKIIYIPNAIEINRFENIGDTKYLYDEFGLKPEDFILVCIGRLNAQKGHRYLFEALNLLNGRYRGKILVVGEGPLLENLKLQVANLNLKDKVIFTGKRKDIPQILHLADGLVLPSLYEGLPLCILEAMAAAKPVIATKAGGIEELVVNQETGFIVPAQNPEALASAIRNLMNLADKGKSMGKKGKEIVIKNFSVNYIAETTTDLFISSINTIR